MAKGKSRNRSEHRDPTPVARTRVLVVRSSYPDPRPFEDRRTYSPEPYTARAFSSVPARITVAPPSPAKVRAGVAKRNAEKGLYFPREQHVFTAPDNVIICLKRKIRREVLHALKLKKSGRGRRRRRNYHSNVRC